MAKRFNVYNTFSNFLSERTIVIDELAVVNTEANYTFPKAALCCKGRFISKLQIPFAGVIENVYKEVAVQTTTTTITNTNLYFLQDKNCFGIGDCTYATDNTDKLSFKFHGQYLFNRDQVTNATAYGLNYVHDTGSNQYRLIPDGDFEYYIYNRPELTYKIVGNPDDHFCKLHTDYNLKTGDYLLKDGTILPLEHYNSNFNSMILGIVVNTEYRSFLPFPIIGYNGIYIQIESFDQTIINDLARNSINEHNGSNIFMSISRYMNIDRIMSFSRFRVIFPSIFNGYNQSLCKMYIPTVFEYRNMIINLKFVESIKNLDSSAIDAISYGQSFSTFANLKIADDNKNYINIIKNGSTFSTSLINNTSDFFFLGNY
jgi:hypothetical protein